MANSRRPERGEEGATLVLALIFMIIIALVLLAAVTLSGDGLQDTTDLLSQQSLEYRSAGAAQVAIQTVRYTDTTYTGGSCFGSGSPTVQIGAATVPVSLNPPVYVTCVSANIAQLIRSGQLPANTGVTREVNVYACGSASCSATNYTVWATVDFQDGSTCSPTSFADCGNLESIRSWLVHNANS